MAIHSVLVFMPKSTSVSAAARGNVTDKREAILRAATSVFAEKGYFNSKVADIAKAAGVADGTVYLYFKNKDDVLHSIFDRAMAEFIAEGRRELASIEKPEDKLRRIAELHLERLGADRDMAIVQEFSAAGFAEYLDVIRGTIEAGQKSGAFRTDLKPIVCAKMLYGALDEMVTNWILSNRSYPLEPMAGEVLKVFFGGLLTK
jgi:TetR/AcrR family fatty acid metabolism transcriptional regulator